MTCSFSNKHLACVVQSSNRISRPFFLAWSIEKRVSLGQSKNALRYPRRPSARYERCLHPILGSPENQRSIAPWDLSAEAPEVIFLPRTISLESTCTSLSFAAKTPRSLFPQSASGSKPSEIENCSPPCALHSSREIDVLRRWARSVSQNIRREAPTRRGLSTTSGRRSDRKRDRAQDHSSH